MNRKLATIRKIQEIKQIENADKICLYRVDGWWVVDSVNKYKVGDSAIYYEIDSFLPVRPEFEFLRKSSFKKMGDQEGFRLKTIRLRGQISQGLLTPVPANISANVGDDLTETLGIVKYEAPIPAQLSGKVKGNFPSFIPKTEEIRIQNFQADMNFSSAGERVYITEKLDGTSFTCYYNNGEFGVCGRNWELTETVDNSLWRMANMLQLKEKLTKHGKNIALQGELIGNGINGNLYNLREHKLYFFTGYDISKAQRMSFEELKWVLFGMELQMVPVIENSTVLPKGDIVDYMLLMAEAKSEINPEVECEGIVVRGLDKEFSFKAISNNYLMSEK